MSSSENPWEEVLSQSQQKSTKRIVPFFDEQAKLLLDASNGKVKGLFSKTFDVNRSLSPLLDFAESASVIASKVSDASLIYRTPESNLEDAGKLYNKIDYCFEIRSAGYRFRVFTIVVGPQYPVVMTVDQGVYRDLAKNNNRYKYDESKPGNITISDDDDLECVFNQLLRSEKLIYICNRLMNETEETV